MVDSKVELLVPNPEINWGKNIYEPNGDLVEQKPGVIRISMGGVMYRLHETPDGLNYYLTALPVDFTYSKVFYGYRGSIHMGWSLAADRPFSFDDPDRINGTAECMQQLAETDQTQISSSRISKEGTTYLQALKKLFGQSNPLTLRRIAVLEDELQNLTSTRFHESFLKIADEMERLGLVEIQLKEIDLKASDLSFSITPDWLRRVYGQQAA